MLTPSTPTRVISNSVSSAHRAEANVSLTPRRPLHATEFISSRRNCRPRACAIATYPATPWARPVAQQVGDRGVRGRIGRDRAAAQRIAMEGDEPEAGLGGEELVEARHPTVV